MFPTPGRNCCSGSKAIASAKYTSSWTHPLACVPSSPSTARGWDRSWAGLADREIVYAPDHVINAGGLIHASARDGEPVHDQVAGIYDTLLGIFERAFAENRSTAEIANDIAESILHDQHREASSAQSC